MCTKVNVKFSVNKKGINGKYNEEPQEPESQAENIIYIKYHHSFMTVINSKINNNSLYIIYAEVNNTAYRIYQYTLLS